LRHLDNQHQLPRNRATQDEVFEVFAELKKLAVQRGEQQQINESGPFVSVHFEMSSL
jgi:putative hemolysin